MTNEEYVNGILNTLLKQVKKGNTYFTENVEQTHLHGFVIDETINTKKFKYKCKINLVLGIASIYLSKKIEKFINDLTIYSEDFKYSCLLNSNLKNKINMIINEYIKLKSKADYLKIYAGDEEFLVISSRIINIDEYLKETFNFNEKDIKTLKKLKKVPIQQLNEQLNLPFFYVEFIKYKEY